MKLIYSELKKFLPSMSKEPQILRDDLTMIGHFTNFYEEIDNEIVFDLDIKVNRGDCLGYYGIARDLAVYYQIELKLPETNFTANDTLPQLPIAIFSPDVNRVQAVKLADVKNLTSPDWLIKILKLHQINSINTLVDLTNYVMLLFGIPCHAFDTVKTTDNLVWENNQNLKYENFTTLDGTILNLDASNLLVTNSNEVLSLSFIGGQNSGIDTTTTETILEMAIYDRTRVRRDSHSLKTITEASIRLEKDLDTDTIPLAFNNLISLVSELTGAHVTSGLFDAYPNHNTPPKISFDVQKPSQCAGIEIPSDFAINCLKRLGCTVEENTITPPSIRKDLTIEEDLIEEVVRFYSYQKIPASEPLAAKNYPDITPKILYLIEELKDKLIKLGYDEVLSWPLVRQPLDKPTAVFTQNSINSDYPVLRQSIIQSLENQLDQYNRYKLPNPQFFEIGKVYSYQNNQYKERYSLGIYHHSLELLQKDLATLQMQANFQDNFAEIILDDLTKPNSYIPSSQENNAIELTSQIITLDANVNLDEPSDPLILIKKYTAMIDPKILWSMQIIDIYQNRYTFRVFYFNCDDKTAKKIHLETFNLKKQHLAVT